VELQPDGGHNLHANQMLWGARGIEAHVIHAASVAVPREHRRAKTDRLDTQLLKRAFLGWLRGEWDHCKMCAIPTFADPPGRRESLQCEPQFHGHVYPRPLKEPNCSYARTTVTCARRCPCSDLGAALHGLFNPNSWRQG
jgi:hypothetical protein